MRIKILGIAAALVALCALFSSCVTNGFKGFYEEDLTKHLTLGEYKNLKLTEYDISVSDEEVGERIDEALAKLS